MLHGVQMFHGGSFFKKRPPWPPEAKRLLLSVCLVGFPGLKILTGSGAILKTALNLFHFFVRRNWRKLE